MYLNLSCYMVPITSSPAWSLGHRKVCDAAFFFFLSLIHLTKDNHTCLCQMPGTGKEKSALTWIVCSTVEKIVQDTQQTCNDLPLTTHTQNSLPLPAGLGWCRTLHSQRKEQPLSRQLCFWLEPWAPRGGYGHTQSFPSHQLPCIPEQTMPWEAVVWTSRACSEGRT